MISPPALKVVVDPATHTTVVPNEWLAEVTLIKSRLGIDLPVHVHVTIDPKLRWHVGLGFHTQIRLAIAAALAFAFAVPIEPLSLASVLSRGGTSGIGALGFWYGGLLFDGGKKRLSNDQLFVPSSSASPSEPTPLVFHRANLPFFPVVAVGRNWDLISGEVERRLFAEFTPIPADEASECARVVYMDLQAAVATSDFEAFCASIQCLSTVGFKKCEIAYRGHLATALMERMTRAGLQGVGMSSWGPACFGFTQDSEMAATAVAALLRDPAVEDAWVGNFAPGAQVQLADGKESSAWNWASSCGRTCP